MPSLPPRTEHARQQLVNLLSRLSEGEALPPERELAATFGVSRMTLRRAIDDFALDGTLERRPGSGTFVSRSRLSRRVAMTSFSDDVRRRGLVPETKVLRLATRPSDRIVAHQLRIPVGDPVTTFTRLRSASGVPLAVETTTIAAALAPGLHEDDLTTSWYQLLADRWGVVVDYATLEVGAILPTADVAEQLAINASQPCVHLKVTSFGRDKHVIELGQSTYRGDRYSLAAELVHPHDSETPTHQRQPKRGTK